MKISTSALSIVFDFLNPWMKKKTVKQKASDILSGNREFLAGDRMVQRYNT